MKRKTMGFMLIITFEWFVNNIITFRILITIAGWSVNYYIYKVNISDFFNIDFICFTQYSWQE